MSVFYSDYEMLQEMHHILHTLCGCFFFSFLCEQEDVMAVDKERNHIAMSLM